MRLYYSQPVSFLLHVKYTLLVSYRIVSYRIVVFHCNYMPVFNVSETEQFTGSKICVLTVFTYPSLKLPESVFPWNLGHEVWFKNESLGYLWWPKTHKPVQLQCMSRSSIIECDKNVSFYGETVTLCSELNHWKISFAFEQHYFIFSQPSIYIDGWLYGMSMTSVVCNVPVLSQNDSTYQHSVFTTWKWHPFATWTPSFIILVWGHHPLIGAKVFACLQNSRYY